METTFGFTRDQAQALHRVLTAKSLQKVHEHLGKSVLFKVCSVYPYCFAVSACYLLGSILHPPSLLGPGALIIAVAFVLGMVAWQVRTRMINQRYVGMVIDEGEGDRHVTVENGRFCEVFGPVRTELQLDQLRDVEEEDGFIFLVISDIFRKAIPVSAFGGEEEKNSFLQAIQKERGKPSTKAKGAVG